MGTIGLHEAAEDLGQSIRTLLEAVEREQTRDTSGDKLALGSALQALNYALAYGMTETARKQCTSARRMIRAALGLEELS